MSEKKPDPLIPARTNHRCPVCGETSYSRAGIHPQCSVRQADEKRKLSLKRDRLADKTEKPGKASGELAAWQKTCPKCKSPQHVRKLVCGCGHRFATKVGRPSSDID